MPFADARPATPPDSARLRQALAFVDGIAIVEPRAFDLRDRDELKKTKLIAKGHASERDFL